MIKKEKRIEMTSHLLISANDTECYKNLISTLRDFDEDAFNVVIQIYEENKNSFDEGHFDFYNFRKFLFAIFAIRMGVELHRIKEFSNENIVCVSISFHKHDIDEDFCDEYGFDDATYDKYYDDFVDHYYEHEKTKYFNIEPYVFFHLLAPICLPSNDFYFDYAYTERFICFEKGHITETGSGYVYEGRHCDREICAYNYFGQCGYQKIFANYPEFNSYGFCEEFIAKPK